MFFDFLGSYAQVAEMETGWRTEGIAKKKNISLLLEEAKKAKRETDNNLKQKQAWWFYSISCTDSIHTQNSAGITSIAQASYKTCLFILLLTSRHFNMLQILQWAWFPSANVTSVFQIFAFNITEDDWILMYSNVLADVLAKGNEWDKNPKICKSYERSTNKSLTRNTERMFKDNLVM